MTGSPLSASKANGGSFASSFISGMLVGALLLWSGHQFWPAEKIMTGASNNALNSQPSASLSLGAPLTRNAIADIAADASQSVVNINTQADVAVMSTPFGNSPFGTFGFSQLFGDQNPVEDGPPAAAPHKMQELGSGSGVIIRQDGYVLTNNHVIRKADAIKITLSDKRTFKARVIGRDTFTDIALLKIDATGLPVARLGNSKDLRPGDFAIAIGSPVGLDQTVTMGIVSALGRSVDGVGNGISLIQTDAAINPGNSGGPLLNVDGAVIGINTAIRGDAQNIGFAIPIDIAQKISDELLAHKSPSHPYIGIYMKDIDEELARSMGVPVDSKGVVVARAAENGPASKAGLQTGDLIQKVDGKAVGSSKELQALVRNHKTGDELHFLILRGNSLAAITVKIGDFPAEENRP